MATIQRENIGVLNDRITVTVKNEDYDPGFQKALKQHSKDANIPGFRKGKVPTSLIKKMYGNSLFPEQVLRAVENGLNDYLKEEKLDLFGQPILEENEKAPRVDMNQPQDYSFEFEVGLKPDFDFDEVKENLDLTRYKIKADDKEIDEEIEHLQQRAATFEELDEVEKDEDIIQVTFVPANREGEILEGKEEDTRGDKFRLSFFSPKLREELKGKKKGDSLPIQLKEAFEDKELEWILKDWKIGEEEVENYFLLKIDQIEKAIPRELNEDFFDEIYPGGDVNTEEDFRKKFTEDIQGQYDAQSRHLLEHEIFETLINESKIELPVDFLKKQLKREEKKLKTDEEVEQEYPEFEKQTKWGVITSNIIEKEKLEAQPEEMKDYFRQQILGYFQMPSITEENQAMVDELTNRLMQEEGRIDEAYRTILTGKLFDWLIENSKITDQEISIEEFNKLQQEHNHEHHEH